MALERLQARSWNRGLRQFVRGGLIRHVSGGATLLLRDQKKVVPSSVPVQVQQGQRKSTLDYCISSVRCSDYENYLCCLLLPQSLRSTALVLGAFNVELAQIRDIVSDRTIGRMRLQFWKEALDRMYAGKRPPQTPVAIELARAMNRTPLSGVWLKSLIEAREDSLYDKPFASVESIETYAEKAVTPVLYLLLEAMAVKDVHADHAASHLGKALGVSTVIRSVPYNLQKGRVLLPMDLLAEHNVSAETVSRLGRGVEKALGVPVTETDVSALRDVVFVLATKAHHHLEKTKDLLARTDSALPKEFKRIFLPLLPCQLFLERLRRSSFDVFHPGLRRKDGLLGARLWWYSKTKL